MSRVAFFVDAGYLFAQGSAALAGEKRPRVETTLNESAFLAELNAVAQAKCDGVRPLRTYWYDAALGSGLTSQQVALANTDYVKLRLGALNRNGQQKGVDSLIVTDMIELARINSISDAVLLSGDEDVRIGVQIAQSYGVSVHLIGIHPARGSQSPALRQEADTNSEWDMETVSRFLTVKPPLATVAAEGEINTFVQSQSEIVFETLSNRIIEEMLDSFDSRIISTIQSLWDAGQKGLPPDIDSPFLRKLSAAAGRRLDQQELRLARREFVTRLKASTQR
jgi:uncharacterized LabA/DUF88 family protein